MRKEKALTTLLTDLLALLADEAARNPVFAARLDQLLAETLERKSARRKSPKAQVAPPLDLHGELQARGEQEFRHRLREQPADAVRASIRAQARLASGSAFLGRGSGA
jgi:hypothetical protein